MEKHIKMNEYQPTNQDKEYMKALAKQQSIFYQIVLYRCLIVVEWCCSCLQADRVNCVRGTRGAVNEIAKWVSRLNKRISRNMKSDDIEKYESDAEFIYDVVLMANAIHPDHREQFTTKMANEIKNYSKNQKVQHGT